MAKRITVMIEDEVSKKLRQIQAKMIQTSAESVSYSKLINDILKTGLKKQ